jgi:hypothetical protein
MSSSYSSSCRKTRSNSIKGDAVRTKRKCVVTKEMQRYIQEHCIVKPTADMLNDEEKDRAVAKLRGNILLPVNTEN